MTAKKIIILILAMAVVSGTSAQDAKKILEDAYAKCKEIKSVHYEMIYRWKALTGKDTLIRNYLVDFEKLNDDTLYSKKFRLQQWQMYEGKQDTFSTWYTGNEEIALNPKDSTATITSKLLYSADIKSFKHNRIFFIPFTSPEHLFGEKILDTTGTFALSGYEKMCGKICAKIIKREADDKDDAFHVFNVTDVVWIDTAANLPLRYDYDLDAVMAADTMHQYLSFELRGYSLNTVYDSNYFSVEAIPKFYKLKDYVPYKQPELLTEGTAAPSWELTSLQGKKYSIKDFTGKILVLDFFYKHCYPCMKALPVLQSLHEKYKDKGLTVIGVDPYDDVKEDEMQNFLDKRGITYLTLFGAKEIAKEYKVSGYPTLYIIDKEGKIIKTEVGYGERTEAELEKIIKEHL